MNTENDKAPVHTARKRGGLRRIAGIALSVIGLFWLAHKAGWIPAEHGHTAIVWPVIVIAVGLFLIFGSRHRHAA